MELSPVLRVKDSLTASKKNFVNPFGDHKNTLYVNESASLRCELFAEKQLKQHAKVIKKKHLPISGQTKIKLATFPCNGR